MGHASPTAIFDWERQTRDPVARWPSADGRRLDRTLVDTRPRGDELSKSTILAILALPAGAIAYVVTTTILSGLALPDGAQGVLLLIVPLFVAGLCMAVFLLPKFDRMAKRDLAAHRAQRAAEPVDGDAGDDPHA